MTVHSSEDADSLEDVRPGDIMFGPIRGGTGALVGAGQLILGEGFRVGPLSVRHVGIVVQASYREGPSEEWSTGVIHAPRLVQAMPGGAEEVSMRYHSHWTARHAYARLPEDFTGQAKEAAEAAREMVAAGVDYSFASYAALAAWKLGVATPRLEAWIDRRDVVGLPREAICSVLVDQAWSLAGKRVMAGVPRQCVTPGALAQRLLHDPDVEWMWPTVR